MAETIRVTIMLNEDKYAALEQQAHEKGLPVATYCRMLLSEFAEVQKGEQNEPAPQAG